MSNFSDDVKEFNEMYGLPTPAKPSLQSVGNPAARLKAFKDILLEEVEEIEEIITAVIERKNSPLQCLTMLADLLGDLQVYCASEMVKFGIPNAPVLGIIMQSNFSKLDATGKVIMDERGKVLKGPHYWKPEPKIEAMLAELLDPKPVTPHSEADFSTWKRDNLERFAVATSAELKLVLDDLKIALRSYRLSVTKELEVPAAVETQ